MENIKLKKSILSFKKITLVTILIFFAFLALFLTLSQYNLNLAQQLTLMHIKENDITYFTWDEFNNYKELVPIYDNYGLVKLSGLDFTDNNKDINKYYKVGYRLELNQKIDNAYISLITNPKNAYVVLLNDQIIYTDFYNGYDHVPNILEVLKYIPDIFNIDDSRIITISLDEHYLGKELTLVEYINKETTIYWYPSIINIENAETKEILALADFGPKTFLSGILITIFSILIILFIYLFLCNKKPWILLLPIFYLFIQIIGYSEIPLSFSQKLFSNMFTIILLLYNYSAIDVLVVFLALKIINKKKRIVIIVSIVHFLFVIIDFFIQYNINSNIIIDNKYLSAIAFFISMFTLFLMFKEYKTNTYFINLKLVFLSYLLGYLAFLVFYRFIDIFNYLEFINPILAIFKFNFTPILKILAFLFVILIAFFSISDFVRNYIEYQTKIKTLERVNSLKTEFLSNVSHELKTPLTVISGYAQSAKIGISESNKIDIKNIEQKMKLISSESERLRLMIEQLLDVNRIEEGRITNEKNACYFDEIIYNTVETYYPILNKNNNQLYICIEDDLPKIFADSSRISQVIINLISNAIRFTYEGSIKINVSTNENFILFSISDTGKGISKEKMPYIFDRYNNNQSLKGEHNTGTGLGLFICKHIIEEHDGQINIASTEEKGTVVTFSLPKFQ